MSSQKGTERTLETLVSELNGADTPADADPAERTEIVVQETTDAVFEGQRRTINDGLVKESLPEMLLLLVALRSKDAHGKGIMEDLDRFFDVQLSPGTVYPMLHELAEDGLLEMRELIQTKEYAVDDVDGVREAMEGAMTQHLALGLVFQQALEELDSSEDA